MKTKYDLGECPTSEEWKTYFKVQEYWQREAVASWLDFYLAEVTQEEFDHMCHRLSKVDFGEDEWDAIGYIYQDEIGRY